MMILKPLTHVTPRNTIVIQDGSPAYNRIKNLRGNLLPYQLYVTALYLHALHRRYVYKPVYKVPLCHVEIAGNRCVVVGSRVMYLRDKFIQRRPSQHSAQLVETVRNLVNRLRDQAVYVAGYHTQIQAVFPDSLASERFHIKRVVHGVWFCKQTGNVCGTIDYRGERLAVVYDSIAERWTTLAQSYEILN